MARTIEESQFRPKNKVIVGIATYKRPMMLEECLKSLVRIDKPQNVAVEVVVVDNDPMGSAKAVIDTISADSPFPMHYLTEKKRGIPFARNTIVKKALELDATEIAFIDDDEAVDGRWLKKLYEFYKENSCDAVAAPVEPILPENTPKWMRKTRYFSRKIEKSGTQIGCASTRNVLFSIEIFTKYKLRFDTRFALTGGTDTLLTKQLSLLGGKILWLDDVLVKERIPETRASQRWLLKRSLRRRINDVKFDLILRGKGYTLFFSYLSFFKNLLFGLGYFPLSLFDKYYYYFSLECFVNACAIVLGLSGYSYNEYKRVHGG